MRYGVLLVVMFLLFLPLWPSQGTPDGVLPVDRTQAYHTMRRGDAARQRQDWPEVVGAYTAAASMYRALAEEAPPWEDAYFQFRIDYCERELELVALTTGRSPASWREGAAPAEPVVTAPDDARYRALLDENRRLQLRVQELELELDTYREWEEIDAARSRRPRDTVAVPDESPEPQPVLDPEPVMAMEPDPPHSPSVVPPARRPSDPHTSVPRR